MLSGRGGNDVGRVYADAGPAVVAVQVRQGGGTASGTGFVVDRDGTVVTNAHVVGDAERARVQFDDNRRRLGAEVLGTDPSSDLAVLKVDAAAVSSVDPLRARELGQGRRGRRRGGDRPSRSASTAPPPPGSCPGSSARSGRPTASRSTR